jgi:putative transposase
MRINRIKPVHIRKHKVTTNSNRSLGIVANVHDGNVTAYAPNRKWAGDIRYAWTAQGCIFHSDRGSQYCAYDYQKLLQKYELTPSMSGKGNCYDNALVETFFKMIKAELIWRQSWPTRRQAEAAMLLLRNACGPGYINGF